MGLQPPALALAILLAASAPALGEQSLRERASLSGHHGVVHALQFSPDGRLLASAGRDGRLLLWDARRGTRRAAIQAQGPLNAVAFSRSGRSLSAGGDERVVRVWALPSLRERVALSGPEGAISALAFSPDETSLAAGSWDSAIRLWSLAPPPKPAPKLAAVKRRKPLASPSGPPPVSAWESGSGRQRAALRGHQSAVNSVCYSPDGKWIASGGWDGRIVLWDAQGNRRSLIEPGAGWIWALSFAPDSRTLAAGTRSGAVLIIDVAGGSVWKRLAGHEGAVFAAAFSPDGETLVTGGADRSVRFWDVPGGAERLSIPGMHQKAVSALALSEDGLRMASGGRDGAIRLFSLRGFGSPLGLR